MNAAPQRRKLARIGRRVEQVDYFAADAVALLLIQRQFAHERGSLVAQRVDRDGLFLGQRELCHGSEPSPYRPDGENGHDKTDKR